MSEVDRRTAWLAARREVVTSTGLAALMHLPDAYSSPMGEWLEKMGRAEYTEEPTERMIWGRQLQQAILVGYAEREVHPLELVDEYELLRSRTCKRLGASLDARWQTGDRRPVDAKNVGWANPVEWGEPYTDQIPPRFITQGHGQMEVCGSKFFELAALFGGNRLVVYVVQRDEEIIAACREVATTFWTRHVLRDIPPPVDGSDEWTKFLRSRKQRLEKYLTVEDLKGKARKEAIDCVALLAAAKEAKSAAEDQESLYGNRLRAGIGEHAGLILPGYRIHYKMNRPTLELDTDRYIAFLERIAVAAGKKPATLAKAKADKFTISKQGNRPLILVTTKEERTSWRPIRQAVTSPALPHRLSPPLLPSPAKPPARSSPPRPKRSSRRVTRSR